MALPLYLAMTGQEMSGCSQLPEQLAYMACHFSAYGTGLSNCPQELPKGAILILNDRTPVYGHDPQTVARQLSEIVHKTDPEAVLLDLQRPGVGRTEEIVRTVTETLSCPVIVSDLYAGKLHCPVFLSTPLPNGKLEDAILPWKHREVWLEAALTCREYTVSETKSVYQDAPLPDALEPWHTDENLCCRYHIRTDEMQARLTLWRDRECMKKLLEQAEVLGVTCAVGLYQQLK